MSADKKKRGSLEVICGSMFSGKTEELMRRLKRAEHGKKHILTLKHATDQRQHYSCVGAIYSHDRQKRIAYTIDSTDQSMATIIQDAGQGIDIIGIDEIQFFDKNIIDTVLTLIDQGKQVIVAGLDLDFRGIPFAIMSTMLCLADKIVKLKAICVICHSDAHYSQRIINGKLATYDDPLILPGSQEYYEARCRNCFIIDRPKIIKQDIVPIVENLKYCQKQNM